MGHPGRFQDPLTCLCQFTATEVHVVCPRCHGPAVITPIPGTDPFGRHWSRRLICRACSLAEDTQLTIGGRRSHVDDRSFPTPLWLRQPCAGHTLWALNAAHLDLLERYVSATLRERGPVRGTLSLLESLPAWMKHAHARDPVLRAITQLRQRLPQ